MSAEFRLGIQSYCFRKFQPLSALVDCLNQVGLEYVELWPGHLDFQAGEDEILAGLQQVRDAGLTVDSYGAVGLDTDEEKTRALLEFCRTAGLDAVTIGDVAPAAYDMTQALCDEYEVNLAFHNHGRRHRLGSFDVLEDLFEQTSPRFGLCLDTAWALDSDEDPVAGVDRFADRLYGVHLKDFTFDEDGRPEDVIVGTGGLDLPALMERLDSIDFSGFLSLEYEGNPDDPMDEVQECMRAVMEAIARLD